MQTKYLLGENRIPTHWYNVIADLPAPPAPVLHPATSKPVTPRGHAPALPDGAPRAGDVARSAGSHIPDEVREIYKLWRPSPLFRAHRLEQALGTPAQHLLQVRGRLAGRLAQAEHRHPAGLLQQARRHEADRHRDRRRAVGLVHGARLPDVRPRVHRLHGEGLVPAEAVPQEHDAALGRGGDPFAVEPHQRRPRHPRAGPGQPGLARHRHLARRSRTPPPARTRATRSAAC